ncbi:MAG: peroxiredoxin [Candidatus Hodarchaeota archaeon]
MPTPKVGQRAPDFTGVTDEDIKLHLGDLVGNIVVLYFYPRANTPGCTKEACSFRDNMIRLVGMGVKVIGVSTDTVKRQAGFKVKHNLNFPLVADADKTIVKLYGVQKAAIGIAKRVTFLIDREGIIRHVWPQVKVSGHVDQIITKIEELGL